VEAVVDGARLHYEQTAAGLLGIVEEHLTG
jgi:hypothetical protein